MGEAEKIAAHRRLLDRLDAAVANFLDADAAWENDELSADDYMKHFNHLKEEMYEVRAEKHRLANPVGEQ